ncbi:MAG TPA: hypothetical protein VFZ59_23035 [Verrucomicrobiae bacterium]|nr:hypothetical protein [Verrucomicrobiae bacterium]
MKRSFLILALLLISAFWSVDAEQVRPKKVPTALAKGEVISFALIHQWEKSVNKDIILNENDRNVLSRILKSGHELVFPPDVHVDFAKHKLVLNYWVYKPDSGMLDEHSIGITESCELLWHDFPAESIREVKLLLGTKGIKFRDSAAK